MLVPREIIDNSEDNKLSTFLKEKLKDPKDANFDVATAFFNIGAYAILRKELGGVSSFRLLLGRAPEIKTDRTFGDELLSRVKNEIEGFDLITDCEDSVKSLIGFLKKENVEVRIYDGGFLHGKAYIFDDLVIIGSSNFTVAGLTHNTELNSVSLQAAAQYTRREWFDKFWNHECTRDFREELIQILEDSRFGTNEYTPYQVYIKALYELQKEDINWGEEGDDPDRPGSMVELTEFQADAVTRILSRLKKYRGVLVADSVGLGKTWIAKKIIEEFGFYQRKRFLVICPAQLRGMWRSEVGDLIHTESIISLEELASEEYLQKARRATSERLEDVELIVVDESHNLRNPLSNKWENFFTLVYDHIAKTGRRPYIVFLTATPINNTIWDLYWQLMLLVGMDKTAFIRENIPDLFDFFKRVDKLEDPSMLGDVLNEISIRRTRDYIIRNYPDATVDGKKIRFPKRELENVDYRLDDAYMGMYDEISDVITNKLKMPNYRLLQYKKEEKLTRKEEFDLGRMMALEGIFRTILLKRLESSIEAFRRSIRKHITFLINLKKYMKNGKLLTKKSFHKYLLMIDEEIDEISEELEDFDLTAYRMEEIFEDINHDIRMFESISDRIKDISPDEDAKLRKLEELLLKSGGDEQVIVFSYYSDTTNYIFNNISNLSDFKNLNVVKISGTTPSKQRMEIVKEFTDKNIDILFSTDVLSEGQNLQSARIIINYDLHWNPTRMIQRAGRIDRIGSPYDKIFIHNFFPEQELEDLLKLVAILQQKIINIDDSIGLDQTILGEEIHPKVFGTIRRIKDKDDSLLAELEEELFGGGEKFYQPLKDFSREMALGELEKLPHGIYSGLETTKMRGIFFYYKYADDFHFWYLYDLTTMGIIKTKSSIVDFISCDKNEARVIPDFFDRIYEINGEVLSDIELTYKEIEQKQKIDTPLTEIIRDKSTKFIQTIIKELDIEVNNYFFEFPEDRTPEEKWEQVKERMLKIPLTKRRLREIRKLWREYQKSGDWKKLMGRLDDFFKKKEERHVEPLEPYDPDLLKLVVIDFIS